MDWIKHLPSILALVGSILTGVFTLVGVWIAQRSNLKQLSTKLEQDAIREREGLLRDRLEELYSLVQKWSNFAVRHYYTYRLAMEGTISYNEALDVVLDSEENTDFHRLLTVADLYFPALTGDLAKLRETLDLMNRVLRTYKYQYAVDGMPNSECADALTDLLQKYDEDVNKYLAALARHAKDLRIST